MTKIISIMIAIILLAIVANSWYIKGYKEGYQKAQQELAEMSIGTCYAKDGCD